MVQLGKFVYLEFDWDDNNLREIHDHGIEFFEIEECFYNSHWVYRNKKKLGRTYETYKLEGASDSGRKLAIIFYVKGKKKNGPGSTIAIIRSITGWDK